MKNIAIVLATVVIGSIPFFVFQEKWLIYTLCMVFSVAVILIALKWDKTG